MDKITFGSYDGILKGQLNVGKSQITQDGSAGQQCEWVNVIPTVPLEHPKGPDFDSDFGKMNEEFRNMIRRRQQEEWDRTGTQ